MSYEESACRLLTIFAMAKRWMDSDPCSCNDCDMMRNYVNDSTLMIEANLLKHMEASNN